MSLQDQYDDAMFEFSTGNYDAAIAGLQKGDEIIAVNGDKVYNPTHVMYEERTMTNGPLKPIRLTFLCGAQQTERSITPERPLSPTNS